MRVFGLEIRRAKSGADSPPVSAYGGGEALRYSPRMSVGQLLSNTSVSTCVFLIANTIASLSCNVYRRGDRGRVRADDAPLFALLRRRPNGEETAFTFWQRIMVNLLLKGNAFVFVGRNPDDSPASLHVLDPDLVDILRDGGGQPYYVYNLDGKSYKYGAESVLHIPALRLDGLRGLSPLDYPSHAARLGLTLDEYTNRSFDGGYHQKIALEVDEDLRRGWKKENSKELIELFKASFGGADRQNDPIVLARAKLRPLDLPSNSDSQLSENREYSEKEIAKLFGVPLFMLGSEKSKFNNMEQSNTFFLQHTLTPWLVRLCQHFDTLLTYPFGDCYVEFDTDTLVRADFNTRWANHRANFQAGLLTLNEVRDMENLPRVDAPYGDEHFGLENYRPLDGGGEDGEPEAHA